LAFSQDFNVCDTWLTGQTKAVTATGDEVVVSEDGVEDLKAMLMW